MYVYNVHVHVHVHVYMYRIVDIVTVHVSNFVLG